MRKGLYWSQLITGIGVGFILAALIWICADQLKLDQLFFNQSTDVVQPEREIVYYDSTLLNLHSAELSFPEEVELLADPSVDPVEDNQSVEETIKPEVVVDEILESTVDSVMTPEGTMTEHFQGEETEIVQFVVNPGDSAETIALRLERLGLASGKEFLRLVHVKNLERKLKAGHYEFEKGTFVTEIITQLIR